MKRLPVLILLSLAFFSCNQADYFYYFEIINKSSVPISYNFNDTPHLIEAKISNTEPRIKSHDRACYTAISNITCDGYGIKVKGTQKYTDNYSTIEYAFEDIEPYELKVLNTLSVPITIIAGNYIDDNGSAELVVAQAEEKTVKIYSKKPVFTVLEPKYSVVIDWEFVVEPYTVIEEDPETGEDIEVEYKTETVYVTIR